MPEINVYVWWSAGRGDGDGYDTEYEITDEEYELFRKCLRDGTDPEDCEEIASVWERIEEELTDELMGNSLEYEDEAYREDCLIDPDSEDYDPDGDEEQFTQDIEDWWRDRYSTGIRLNDFDANEHTFTVTVLESGETEFEFNLYEDEEERLEQLGDEGESIDSLEDDDDYGYLYEELMDEAKKKIREDLDLTGDDTDVDELEFSISYY